MLKFNETDKIKEIHIYGGYIINVNTSNKTTKY